MLYMLHLHRNSLLVRYTKNVKFDYFTCRQLNNIDSLKYRVLLHICFIYFLK